MRWLDGITDWTDMSVSKLSEIVKNREAWRAACPWGGRVRHKLATEQPPLLKQYFSVEVFFIFLAPTHLPEDPPSHCNSQEHLQTSSTPHS